MNWNSYLTSAVVGGTIGVISGLFITKKVHKTKEKQETTTTIQENVNVTHDKDNCNNKSAATSSSKFNDSTIIYDNKTGELFIGNKVSNEDLKNFISIFQDFTPNDNSSSNDDKDKDKDNNSSNDKNNSSDNFTENATKKDSSNNCNLDNEERPTNQ